MSGGYAHMHVIQDTSGAGLRASSAIPGMQRPEDMQLGLQALGERRRVCKGVHGHAHAGVRLQIAGQLLLFQRLALQGVWQIHPRLADLVGLQADLQSAPWSATAMDAARLVASMRQCRPEG